jgi:hypothetical protein
LSQKPNGLRYPGIVIGKNSRLHGARIREFRAREMRDVFLDSGAGEIARWFGEFSGNMAGGGSGGSGPGGR